MKSWEILEFAQHLVGGSFIFDEEESVVWMADIKSESGEETLRGLYFYHLKNRGEELKKQCRSFGCGLQEVCLEGCAAPGEPANEYGSTAYRAFDQERSDPNIIAGLIVLEIGAYFGDRPREDFLTEEEVCVRYDH